MFIKVFLLVVGMSLWEREKRHVRKELLAVVWYVVVGTGKRHVHDVFELRAEVTWSESRTSESFLSSTCQMRENRGCSRLY